MRGQPLAQVVETYEALQLVEGGCLVGIGPYYDHDFRDSSAWLVPRERERHHISSQDIESCVMVDRREL